jgi:predicted dehydrogenase
MKQVLRKGLKEVVVDEVPDPMPSPHHVLVRPVCSLISAGTETASIHTEGLLRGVAENPSHIKTILDAVKVAGPVRVASEVSAKLKAYGALGYAGAGILVDRHPSVTDVDVGARVAYGGEGTGHAETVSAGRLLVARIPDEVSFEEACFTTLGAIAMHSVRLSGLAVGDVVAVVGLGMIGQLVAQIARAQGAVVIGLDLRAERIEMAKQLGADHAFASTDETERRIYALTEGRGADCVIVAAAAKSSAPVDLALRICRERGKVVVVGAVEMNLSRDLMYVKEIDVVVSRAYGPGSYDPSYEKQGRDYPAGYVRWTENRNMEEFLRLVASRRVDVRPMISHRFNLDDAPKAYETIMTPGSTSLAVILTYPSPTTAAADPSFTARRRVAVTTPSPARPGELRVGLIGAGNLAKWAHLPNIQQIPGVRLHAVYSASGPRGKTYAKRFGAAYCTSDLQEMLRDADVDIVLIASRNQEHAEQAEAALRAGKHVFLEKPMALTELECRALDTAVAESGRLLTVGFNRRFAPFYMEQKRVLSRRSGPAVVNVRVNSPGLSGTYWAAEASQGGAILGEGCHFVDLMHWLLDSEPVWVSATSLPTDAKEPIGEHNVVASVGFADGSIGSLTYSTIGSKTSAGERVEGWAPGIGCIVEDFKWFQSRTSMRRTQSKWWPEKGYATQMKGFIDAIRRGETPAVTVRDGARATLVCLRLLESARDRMPRAIDLAGLVGDATRR